MPCLVRRGVSQKGTKRDKVSSVTWSIYSLSEETVFSHTEETNAFPSACEDAWLSMHTGATRMRESFTGRCLERIANARFAAESVSHGWSAEP